MHDSTISPRATGRAGEDKDGSLTGFDFTYSKAQEPIVEMCLDAART